MQNWKVAEDVDLRRAVEQLVRESWGEFKVRTRSPSYTENWRLSVPGSFYTQLHQPPIL